MIYIYDICMIYVYDFVCKSCIVMSASSPYTYNDINDIYDMYDFVCKSCIGSSASSPTEAKTTEVCSFQRFSISNSNF